MTEPQQRCTIGGPTAHEHKPATVREHQHFLCASIRLISCARTRVTNIVYDLAHSVMRESKTNAEHYLDNAALQIA